MLFRSLPFSVEFQDGSIFAVRHTRQFERLVRPFSLPFDVRVPASDYRYEGWVTSFTSDKSKPISGSVAYSHSEFYDGILRAWTYGAIFRAGYRLRATLDVDREHITLPRGEFTTNLVGSHIDYAFSPKLYLNTFFQYNNETDSIKIGRAHV